MRKEYTEYVCALHGYLIRTKELHWNTQSNAEHILCDEIHSELEDCEDKFAEACMGYDGKKFRIHDLLPMLPNSTELLPMLKELEEDTLKVREKAEGYKEYGVVNIIDDILTLANKYKYRSTQK